MSQLIPFRINLRISAILISLSLGLLLPYGGQAQEELAGWSKPIDITEGATENWRAFGVPLCDPYQHLHIFWTDNSDDSGAVFHREENERDWSSPVDVIVMPNSQIRSLEAVVSEETDTVHLLWVDDDFNGGLYHTRSSLFNASDARSWSKPEMLDSGVFNGSIMIDKSGTIHVIYSASIDGGILFEVLYIFSLDGGITWTEPEVILSKSFSQPSYIRVRGAIDEKSRIHVGVTIRSQEYGHYSEVGYIRSDDGVTSWSDYRLIEANGSAWQGVEWIAPYTFGEDEIHLTWQNPDRLHQWSLDGGITWSEPIEIMPLGAAFGGENQVTLDSSGTLHAVIAWFDGVFSTTWDGEKWGKPEPIDERPIDPHGQRIVACQGNRLHVVYYDRTGDTTVWYATREVEAPIIPKKPLPALTATEAPTFEPELDIILTASATPVQHATPTLWMAPGLSQGQEPSYTLAPLTIGIISSAVFIALFLISLFIRKNR